jgi:hypothetical protein
MQSPDNGGSNWYNYKGLCSPFAMQITVSLISISGLMVEREMRVYLHLRSLRKTLIIVVWVFHNHNTDLLQ